MADDPQPPPRPTRTQTLIENRRYEDDNDTTDIDDDDDDVVIEKLEVEVKQMAESILHYRQTLPIQLRKTFASLLDAQRPPPPPVDDAFPSPRPSQTVVPGILNASGGPNPDAEDNLKSSEVALLGEEDPETAEKIRLLKFKIPSNVSSMPVVLKRMNDCISMIDKLDTDNANIFPAFKRKNM